jgi:hypothetical protein
MTTTEQSGSHFLYPDLHLSQHSSLLSFPTVTIETVLGISSPSTPSTGSCYRTMSKYSAEEYKKTLDKPLDAKLYFAKVYGKKDMFSKEMKIENKLPLPRPVSVNLEETLLQVSGGNESLKTETPQRKNKSTLGNLFGGFEDEVTAGSPPSSPPTVAAPTSTVTSHSAPTFSGFDAFDSFSSPSASKTNQSDASGSVFDAFSSPSPPRGSSKPFSSSTSLFDAFDAPVASSASSSFPAFDAFDHSFAVPAPVPPPALAPPTELTIDQSLTALSELLCIYKHTAIDKFQLSGSLHFQFTLSPTTPSLVTDIGADMTLMASFRLTDPSKKLVELLPASSSVSTQLTTLGATILCSLPWDEKFLTEHPFSSPPVSLAKFLVSPSFRPEFLRTRMNVTRASTPAPGGGGGGGGEQSTEGPTSVVIAIQLMLNKNYPQLSYEGLQVMVSLTGLPEISGEIKTRPTGAFTAQTKILTWRCGNQSAGKQPLLQMEAIIPLLHLPSSPLPSSLPVIVKALINDTTILPPDCVFEMDSVAVMRADGTPSPSISLHPSGRATGVAYKSKVEYRFL